MMPPPLINIVCVSEDDDYPVLCTILEEEILISGESTSVTPTPKSIPLPNGKGSSSSSSSHSMNECHSRENSTACSIKESIMLHTTGVTYPSHSNACDPSGPAIIRQT